MFQGRHCTFESAGQCTDDKHPKTKIHISTSVHYTDFRFAIHNMLQNMWTEIEHPLDSCSTIRLARIKIH